MIRQQINPLENKTGLTKWESSARRMLEDFVTEEMGSRAAVRMADELDYLFEIQANLFSVKADTLREETEELGRI